MPLIRTQKDLNQAHKEYGDNLLKMVECANPDCKKPIGMPPAIRIGHHHIYHVKCAMQIVYATLEALSGHSPESAQQSVQPAEQQQTMADAFRDAAQQRSQSK